jgi:two-component system chemotaxis sensor kinase CheA
MEKTIKQPIVMVLEDEMLLLNAITKKLKLNGMETVSCSSGKQAIDYLENMDEELPHAVWLDYYLGDMNGLEFVQALKRNKKWRKIPVVVVSNSASSEKVHNMLALGVKKYLLKAEYRLDEIIEVVRTFIESETNV